MGMIRVLDPHTAELIAAGEVVERPASVVKELTENALDAGAKNITVSIERGGVSMIQIADDGCGVEAEDIPNAFIRHATSKIRSEEDLGEIRTLGFRGEALASIASVSRVELLTKTGADEYAYLYRISGGEQEGIEPAARATGTTITVRSLFYNTPARMKFLKKDQSEGNYVSDVVKQLALSHPEVALKFVRDGKLQFQTPGDGDLLGAAYAVLSRDFARETLEVDGELRNYHVHGLVTLPTGSRASRSMQFFYVNGRFVRDRTMMAALEAAYKGVTMQGKYPGCILFLNMPPALVDVNVHPAKTEIRFAEERCVFDAVYGAVRNCIFRQLDREPAADFYGHGEEEKASAPAAPAPPAFAAEPPAAEEPARDVLAAPEIHVTRLDYGDMVARPPLGEKLRPGVLASRPLTPYPYGKSPDIIPTDEPPRPAPEQTSLTQDAPCEPLRLVGEVFDTYIVAQRRDDMCLVDKHAAHERLLYESLMASRGTVSSQLLMLPVTVQLSAEEKDAILQSKTLLQENGMELEDFGGTSVIVRAVPADVEPENIQDLVLELAQKLLLDPHAARSEKTEWVLASVCCRAAVKAGDKTDPAKMLRLAQDVLDGLIPPFCPHGRPIVLKISRKELEKRFGRQG